MDEETRLRVTISMMGLCLLLGMVGLLGSSWQVEGDVARASLGKIYSDVGTSSECQFIVEYLEMGECKGDMWAVSWSDMCEFDSDFCGMDTAGTVAKIFLWPGVLLSLLSLLFAVSPTMRNRWEQVKLPDRGKTILQWAPGTLILLGFVLWMLFTPSEATSAFDLGFSAYAMIMAGLLGLGSTVLDNFEINVNITRREEQSG